jgi:putative nucleotidyltransferase with HDIG domain
VLLNLAKRALSSASFPVIQAVSIVGMLCFILLVSIVDYLTQGRPFQVVVPAFYFVPVVLTLLFSRPVAVVIALLAGAAAGAVVFLKGSAVAFENTSDLGVFVLAVIAFLALYAVVGAFVKAVARREQAEQQARRLQELFCGVVSTLSRVLDARDPHTARHSQSVAEYALAIGKEMGLGCYQQEVVYFAGLLHDIGKIAVSGQPLKKPGKLGPQEWEEIRRHPVLSYRILRDIPKLREIAVITLYHHERWDGGGYPYGLKGEEIPIGARILGVADSFDAMVSERAYKPQISPEMALRELELHAGSQFDPRVVEAFLRCFRKGAPAEQMVLKGQLQLAAT